MFSAACVWVVRCFIHSFRFVSPRASAGGVVYRPDGMGIGMYVYRFFCLGLGVVEDTPFFWDRWEWAGGCDFSATTMVWKYFEA